VGERKDSQTYVRNKKKACEEVGVISFGTDLPETATEDEVLAVVAAYNTDPAVHGILVQLPLPKHMNEERILDAISIEKDVDGFHPLNIGALAMRGRNPLFVPCTPKGCIELLRRTGVKMSGKKAAVVGRSNIVGMPAALLLQREDATVTVIHSRTPNAAEICADADIIVAACGQAEMVKGDWIKEGAAVIDVGINAVDVGCLLLMNLIHQYFCRIVLQCCLNKISMFLIVSCFSSFSVCRTLTPSAGTALLAMLPFKKPKRRLH